MISNYKKYKERYLRSGCTKEQLKKLVSLKVLTEKEYEMIINNK